MSSIQDIIRAKQAEFKKDTERRLAEINSQSTDIEAEIRCMWEMILDEEPGYGTPC